LLWIDNCDIFFTILKTSTDVTKKCTHMSALSAFLAHKGLVLATIAASALLVLYVMPLDSMSEVFAAKGGDPGPPIPPVPGEGNHYGWVKKGGPPPKPK
jgi:hypothetical protein